MRSLKIKSILIYSVLKYQSQHLNQPFHSDYFVVKFYSKFQFYLIQTKLVGFNLIIMTILVGFKILIPTNLVELIS